MAVSEFWQKIERTDTCWVWRGACGGEGYGALQVSLRYKKAHRVAWELTYGQIPDGMCVLHRCDNPPCVRPSHLWLGTRAENNRDRAAKGRSARTHPGSLRGEKHYRAKLTEDQVRQIRTLLSRGATQVALASEFHMSRRAIRAIRDGGSWGWLP